jgi:hypothetical protein
VQAGINIVLKALESPARQIAENSGVEGSIVVGKILENKSKTYGFDAQKEQYVDLVDAGIIDPAKVVRAALQDAASVAGLLVTTEAMVAKCRRTRPRRRCRPAAAWVVWISKSGRPASRKCQGRGASRALLLCVPAWHCFLQTLHGSAIGREVPCQSIVVVC